MSRAFASTAVAVAVATAAVVAAGCRSGLRTDPLADAPRSALADRSRPAPRTIPLELIFVRFEEHDPLFRDELWNLVDEQVLDDSLRRRLHANGLRAGVVPAHLPPHIAERFLPTAAAATESLPTALPDNPALVRHLLRLLPGRSSDVVTATGISELVLLEHDDGGIRGRTYGDASPLFELRSWSAADGRVRLRLAPTIKHGPVERSWVGEEGMFRLEAGQRRDELAGLTFEVTLPAGSMVVIGCVGEPASSVGDAFFRDRTGSRAGQRLLAIRPEPLAQRIDPMFAAEDVDRDGDPGAEDATR
jgi:hypothetical protein